VVHDVFGWQVCSLNVESKRVLYRYTLDMFGVE
jgi:hypothetical protein